MSGTMSVIFPSTKQPARRRQSYVAPAALVGAGLLLAVSTNLAKVAQGIGVTPLAYLTWSLAGAALLLAVISYVRGQSTRVNRRSVEYFVVSGSLTVAGSNLIFFNAVTHLGVSFVALMISLPPLLTYVGALMLRTESFCWWRATGVVLALVGTTYLVFQKWVAPDADTGWILLTLLGPLLLSAGNLYRTLRWPPGATAQTLAPGTLLGAIAALALFALVPGWSLSIPTESAYAGPLIATQAAVFVGQFLLLFVLQKAGGPVFLSLMGCVSAVFGVPIAMILLAEPALPAILPSAALIAAGTVLVLLGATACQRSITRSLRICR